MSKITNEEKKGYFYSTKIGMEILGTLVENPNLILEKNMILNQKILIGNYTR